MTWQRVIEASDCPVCDCCGEELLCPVCDVHYAECSCPGPHQDDEFEYRRAPSGGWEARRLPEAP